MGGRAAARPGERRPCYEEYIAPTSSFIPLPPKRSFKQQRLIARKTSQTRDSRDFTDDGRLFGDGGIRSGPLTPALFLVGIGLAMGAEGWWSFGRDRKGQIGVTLDGIIEQSKSQTTLVPWVHVKAARIRDLNEENAIAKWFLQLFGRQHEYRYV